MKIFKPRCFKPHDFASQVEFVGEAPWVLIDWKALMLTWHFVDLCSEEVSWLGTVKKLEVDYLIEEVFLFDQTVGPGSTSLCKDDVARVANELIKKGQVDKANRLRFWGHSHVNGGTGPSGRDNEQMLKDFPEDAPGLDFMIRGIFNKSGRAEFAIYEYHLGRIIYDAVWDVYQKDGFALRKQAEAEVKAKVKQYRYVQVSQPGIPKTHSTASIQASIATSKEKKINDSVPAEDPNSKKKVLNKQKTQGQGGQTEKPVAPGGEQDD